MTAIHYSLVTTSRASFATAPPSTLSVPPTGFSPVREWSRRPDQAQLASLDDRMLRASASPMPIANSS